jgi:alpha-galactosidase
MRPVPFFLPNMKTNIIKLTALTFLGTLLFAHAGSVRLDELDLTPMTAGWGQPQKNRSTTQTPLAISGERFDHGVGTHAASEVMIRLNGKAKLFTAKVGVDDDAGSAAASVEFIILGDGRQLWRSGVCKLGDKPRDCRVELDGIKSLELMVNPAGDGINYDHADWVDATFEFDGVPPQISTCVAPDEEAVLLTPPAPHEPRINGPKVYGVRPGSPFLFRIPCTGERPLLFRAEGLPEGLALDPQTGIITGKMTDLGTHHVVLFARNGLGEARRGFRIEVGNKLALTPPMGWNSWYIDYNRVSEAAMRDAADRMIASGMADFGYQYVNSDDCWGVSPSPGETPRAADGQVLPNKRFPDIKGMVNYIHAKGLKAGIYISPGPLTCTGCEGSWQHEAQDAATFAGWGFDFLKYDWCTYGGVAGGNTVPDLKKPYQLMWNQLQKQNRDIVFNLCQYGMGEVWKWGGDVGNCWRTTGDLGLEPGTNLPGFYHIGMSNASHWEYARPGAWNDPDYILIGWVGNANGMGEGKKTTLIPNEQYSYMSMWSLMAAPLIFGGDMTKLDAFTLNVLCNTEVIDVDQDPLGKQAKILRQTPDEFVLVKELEDGSKAVGLFNLSLLPRTISVSWKDLGITGNQHARDLWRQKELGVLANEFTMEVPRHGVALVRIGPDKAN